MTEWMSPGRKVIREEYRSVPGQPRPKDPAALPSSPARTGWPRSIAPLVFCYRLCYCRLRSCRLCRDDPRLAGLGTYPPAKNTKRREELRSFVVYMGAVWKCRYFWLSLVRMDLRTRYRRSILGMGWS